MDSNRSTVINCYGETEIIDNENEARSAKREAGSEKTANYTNRFHCCN